MSAKARSVLNIKTDLIQAFGESAAEAIWNSLSAHANDAEDGSSASPAPDENHAASVEGPSKGPSASKAASLVSKEELAKLQAALEMTPNADEEAMARRAAYRKRIKAIAEKAAKHADPWADSNLKGLSAEDLRKRVEPELVRVLRRRQTSRASIYALFQEFYTTRGLLELRPSDTTSSIE